MALLAISLNHTGWSFFTTGTSTVATVTVLANDSPYGVVSWERTAITVAEPEGTDTSVAVTITRRQGLERAIRVNYV